MPNLKLEGPTVDIQGTFSSIEELEAFIMKNVLATATNHGDAYNVRDVNTGASWRYRRFDVDGKVTLGRTDGVALSVQPGDAAVEAARSVTPKPQSDDGTGTSQTRPPYPQLAGALTTDQIPNDGVHNNFFGDGRDVDQMGKEDSMSIASNEGAATNKDAASAVNQPKADEDAVVVAESTPTDNIVTEEQQRVVIDDKGKSADDIAVEGAERLGNTNTTGTDEEDIVKNKSDDDKAADVPSSEKSAETFDAVKEDAPMKATEADAEAAANVDTTPADASTVETPDVSNADTSTAKTTRSRKAS